MEDPTNPHKPRGRRRTIVATGTSIAGPRGHRDEPHVHHYVATGRSKERREKRGWRWYIITNYEEKCQNAGCPLPFIWDANSERLA